MFDDAFFTFEQCSNPHWPCLENRPRSYTFVPDEIFAPALSVLQKYAPHILSQGDWLHLQALKARHHEKWSWPETLSFLRTVWDGIDIRYGTCIGHAVDDAAFRYRDVDVGRGSGICNTDDVHIRSEKTINDPVCVAHESGHLMSFLMAPDQNDNDPADNVREIQSMFLQEHAYARLVADAVRESDAQAARLHRMSYYVENLSYIPLCLALMEQEKTGKKSLAEQFTKWAVDPALISHLERCSRNNGDKERVTPQDMHKHSFAALLAPALYQRFQGMEPDVKQSTLAALYEHGAETVLVDVLAAFDIHTPDDVRVAAEETCRNFKAEIRLLVPKAVLPDMAL